MWALRPEKKKSIRCQVVLCQEGLEVAKCTHQQLGWSLQNQAAVFRNVRDARQQHTIQTPSHAIRETGLEFSCSPACQITFYFNISNRLFKCPFLYTQLKLLFKSAVLPPAKPLHLCMPGTWHWTRFQLQIDLFKDIKEQTDWSRRGDKSFKIVIYEPEKQIS